jgi:sec-independent protein translocase protein TatC
MSHDDADLSRAPLLTHLLELRTRLLYCMGFFALMFGVSYLFAQDIYAFLQQPLAEIFGPESGRRMIYTGLHEAFLTYLKLAFFAALFITLPLALIQVWKFIAPGLYKNEQRSLSPLFVMTPVLFVLVAALIMPPDLVSQLALGLPVVALYELSILLIRWTGADEEGQTRAAAGKI